MSWRDEHGRVREGQKLVSTAMIPPPATERPKPPPPNGGWPRRDVAMVAYDLPLRQDLLVRLTLPRDLTPEEAERLCGIIRTLPLPSDPDIWVTTESVNKAKP